MAAAWRHESIMAKKISGICRRHISVAENGGDIEHHGVMAWHHRIMRGMAKKISAGESVSVISRHEVMCK